MSILPLRSGEAGYEWIKALQLRADRGKPRSANAVVFDVQDRVRVGISQEIRNDGVTAATRITEAAWSPDNGLGHQNVPI